MASRFTFGSHGFGSHSVNRFSNSVDTVRPAHSSQFPFGSRLSGNILFYKSDQRNAAQDFMPSASFQKQIAHGKHQQQTRSFFSRLPRKPFGMVNQARNERRFGSHSFHVVRFARFGSHGVNRFSNSVYTVRFRRWIRPVLQEPAHSSQFPFGHGFM